MMRDDDEDDEEGERGQHNNNRPVGEVAERREEKRGRILFKSTPLIKGGSSIYARSGLKERLAGVEREVYVRDGPQASRRR